MGGPNIEPGEGVQFAGDTSSPGQMLVAEVDNPPYQCWSRSLTEKSLKNATTRVHSGYSNQP